MPRSNRSRSQPEVLKYRRNALAPISSLPTEVIIIIFSILCLPATSPRGGKPDHHWHTVAHVCHQWREIAINQPVLWSHVDFNKLPLACVAEILARAKEAPLHLVARFTGCSDDKQFSLFKKELLLRVSNICHLTIGTGASYYHRILEGLASPAPNLEYLSLSYLVKGSGEPVPDTLFDSTTPRLSCLELRNCDVSWKSPLLKGLRYLKIRSLFHHESPSLADWLDALEQMPQMERLVLHSASPDAPFLPFDIGRTATLPSLTHLDISASVGDCAFALAHLALPAITCLCLALRAEYWTVKDAHVLIPYVARHAYGPQDTQPLQSVLICDIWSTINILAWSVPDIIVEPYDLATWRAAAFTARVALSISRAYCLEDSYVGEVMAALPLDNLTTLTAQYRTRLHEQFWLRHAPRWPLLQRVHLAANAASGLSKMLLLQDSNGGECPLLPSLTKFGLIHINLSERRTLRLCDAFMMRVEQGVPLETLDLLTCDVTSQAVQLLSEIVADVLVPEACHLCPFVTDDDSQEGGPWEDWEVDNDDDEEMEDNEEEESYSELEGY